MNGIIIPFLSTCIAHGSKGLMCGAAAKQGCDMRSEGYTLYWRGSPLTAEYRSPPATGAGFCSTRCMHDVGIK